MTNPNQTKGLSRGFYQVQWAWQNQDYITYYCGNCWGGRAAGGPTSLPESVRGPILPPADALCAGCGKGAVTVDIEV